MQSKTETFPTQATVVDASSAAGAQSPKEGDCSSWKHVKMLTVVQHPSLKDSPTSVGWSSKTRITDRCPEAKRVPSAALEVRCPNDTDRCPDCKSQTLCWNTPDKPTQIYYGWNPGVLPRWLQSAVHPPGLHEVKTKSQLSKHVTQTPHTNPHQANTGSCLWGKGRSRTFDYASNTNCQVMAAI